MKKLLLTLSVIGCGHLFFAQTNGKVGVNTSLPTEIFDVNGTLRVRSIPVNNKVGVFTKPDGTASTAKDQLFTGISTLMIDKNGVIGSYGDPTSATPTKPINYVPYKITTTSADEWINDFDTKISTSLYTMILTDVILSATNGTETRQVFIQKPSTDTTTRTGSAFGNFSTFQQNGTWHINLEPVVHLEIERKKDCPFD